MTAKILESLCIGKKRVLNIISSLNVEEAYLFQHEQLISDYIIKEKYTQINICSGSFWQNVAKSYDVHRTEFLRPLLC